MAEFPKFVGYRLQVNPHGPDEDGHVTAVVSMEEVDVSRLVFCHECRFYLESQYLPPNKFCYRSDSEFGLNTSENDFCSFGERLSGSAKA